MPISVEVRGEIAARNQVTGLLADLRGTPLVGAMRQTALLVERGAKRNAPVDTGRLRGSIGHEIRRSGIGAGGDTQAVVGSNVEYAPDMEFGTGTFVGRPAYLPPAAALEVWARRHGTTGDAVANAIFKAGGLKPRRFLQRAFESNKSQIVRIIEGALADMVARRNRGT
ncbi:MAG: HK97-gp10 family putative phage morphogenesis protein [Chloroflexota bacterium]|nr:HK97-gp10 family putative phage morphogenesis protein [Chloroflexota bacterium]